MPRPDRIVLLLLACACAKPGVPTCATSSECPATARCIRQACVENAPPVASVALPPAPLTANALLAFDGSGSSDPDADDSVTSWAWTFRTVSAPCAAPVVAGTGPTALVRFACPGSYAVDLSVEDELSRSSPVATVTFEVEPYEGPVLVEAGPDVAVDHACSGVPLLCATASPVALSATAPGATGPVTFEWSATPPPGRCDQDSTCRVTFVPDRFSAFPIVAIETDGTAISGDWVLRVEVRDDAGVLGTAVTRVSVGNRPPVVVATVPAPDHAFEGTQLSASGEIAVSVTDPDGDPIASRQVAWHHAGDGPSSVFEGSDLGTRITFGIVVPYTAPSDAAFLIGGIGLERSVDLTVRDVNDAQTVTSWPIVVRNRPPAPVSSPTGVSVDHSYDDADQAYEAVAPLSRWLDPDGDPLVHVGATGDAACASIEVDAAGQASASCSLPFAGTPALANFAGTHVVTQRIADFWTDTVSSISFDILNRAPYILPEATVSCSLPCTVGSCCHMSGEGCFMWWVTFHDTVKTVPSRFADADGDPLTVQVEGDPFVCLPAECSFVVSFPEAYACGYVDTSSTMTASDGAAGVTGTLPKHRWCMP